MKLTIFAIYHRPKDFPNNWVVRRWRIELSNTEPVPDLAPWCVTDSIAVARHSIPKGLVGISRSDDDDEAIMEVWL